ncbi:SHOCT domain-containing protein [Microbacterium sp.]|uniref:SHOCT domain-containing protein n=1 Tax=Microbacterium sp. TaxID=51671 RepID=UPI002D78B993|nr:SHOCT domain-containing protein [Microbacterium sp.]HET6299989.1 SHOCT domain-containing protein [Microbacterium sp.]
MSEHHGELVNVKPTQQAQTAQKAHPQWVRLADGRFRWWNGDCWTDYFVINPNDPAEVESARQYLAENPPRWIQQPDQRFRWWGGLQWTDDYTRDPRGDIEYLPQQAPHNPPQPSAAEELERLASLYAAGHITAEEFAAAKARALRL